MLIIGTTLGDNKRRYSFYAITIWINDNFNYITKLNFNQNFKIILNSNCLKIITSSTIINR